MVLPPCRERCQVACIGQEVSRELELGHGCRVYGWCSRTYSGLFCSKPSCDLTLKQTCLMRGHLGRGAPYGGHAPGVTRAMVTHGLQLVLWTPWPQALQHTSRRRYCVNVVSYRSHFGM